MRRLMSRNIIPTTESREEKSYVKDILEILFGAGIRAESVCVRVTIKNQTTNILNLKIKI